MEGMNFDNLNLNDEEEELTFDLEGDADNNHDVNLCLVGRFVHDRPIKFNIMKVRMADVWRPVKSMVVKEASPGLYLFKFFHPMDVEEVLKGGPWTFDNFTLIIERLKVGIALHDIQLFHVNFWVQIHNVPIGMMLEKVGKGLANYIGEFLEYDKNNNTSFWRNYMRVKVRFDVRKPLRVEKKISVIGGGGGIVKFKYEKLGLFCFVCGLVGHSESKCEVKYAMERDDGRRNWSNEIRAEVRRSGGRVESRWLREEGSSKANTDAGSQDGETRNTQPGPSQPHTTQPRTSTTHHASNELVVLSNHRDGTSTQPQSLVIGRSGDNLMHARVTNLGSILMPQSSTEVIPQRTRVVPERDLSQRDVPPVIEEVLSENVDMSVIGERKRRRAEGPPSTDSTTDVNQHFLSAAIDVEGRSGELWLVRVGCISFPLING
ncbi:hypothetical protein P8452_54940 [Trifolium repens]|nr:hypothetical protein P8452_54940 [Trifolium repens]